MPTRDRLIHKTKQGATSIVHFGWQVNLAALKQRLQTMRSFILASKLPFSLLYSR
jgi:hypothetical protein